MLTPSFDPTSFHSMPVFMLSSPVDGSVVTLPAIEALEGETKTRGKALLITEHLRLVRVIARQIHARLPRHVDLDELVAAGTLGLVDAATRFDTQKSVQFKTYASFRIRGAILDLLRTSDWSPRVLRRQARALEQATLTLHSRGILTPTEVEIAEELGLSLAGYQALRQQIESLNVGSLQAERREESGTEESEYIPGPETADPLFRCLDGELRQELVEAIELLPDRERLVLNLYYHEELTMRQVAEVMGIVESRVSQLHGSAIARLRKAISRKKAPSARNAAVRTW